MSRPPVPHPAESTGSDRTTEPGLLDYLPLEYGDLLDLEDQLAVRQLGRAVPGPRAGGEEADTTRTFMELSALVAHVLAAHQRRYASEAFIGTAMATSNMLRHARRLGYQPDAGLAASGYVVVTAKRDVRGTVAAGLPLATVPVGDQAAQDYETLEDLELDADLDDVPLMGATKPVRLDVGDDRMRLAGVGHRLRPGDPVALVGPHWQGFVIAEVHELPAEDATVVVMDRKLTGSLEPGAAAEAPALLVRPTRTMRPFGWNADPALYPPKEIRNAGGPAPTPGTAGTSTVPFWYDVQRADAGGYADLDVYLAAQEPETLLGSYVLRRSGTDAAVLRVDAEAPAAVALFREAAEPFVTHQVTIERDASGNFTSSTVEVPRSQTVRSHISSASTAIRVVDRQGVTRRRGDHPVPADWLTGWTAAIELSAREPNASALPKPLFLVGELPGLTPGRALAFTSRSGPEAEIVTVRRVQVEGTVQRRTAIWWDTTGVGAPPTGGWTLADLRVHGNVARVSHGRTVHAALGGSDGVTPFQRYPLKAFPVTVLAGVAGGEPALEVRVDGVRWTRVPDLAASGPDDRHYRSETDDLGVTTVVFGDGANGAVPPSGVRNLTATYRVGLGPEGDAGAGRLSRLTRAHPLIARVSNPTPVLGGAAPAGIADTRSQAPRFIRTFDRAVSLPDLADLALTFPGIARAAVRWDQAAGAVLVVATARGDSPPVLEEVRAFLDARRDVTVPLRIVGPVPHGVRLTVEIEADPAHLAEVVKGAVRSALHGAAGTVPGMFTFPARGLGQPAYLSEVYQRLDALPAVLGVRVSEFASLDRTGVADVVLAGVEEWLRLGSSDLAVTVVGEAR